MEQWTIAKPYEGLFRMIIEFSGSNRFWCMFDYSVIPIDHAREVEIEMAADADVDTIRWFDALRQGMLEIFRQKHEQGREYVGIHILVSKIHAHDIDTTEYGCQIYGQIFVHRLVDRSVPVPAPS